MVARTDTASTPTSLGLEREYCRRQLRSAPGRGLTPRAAGVLGFASSRCTSLSHFTLLLFFFVVFGECSAEFGPVSTLLGNLRGPKIRTKNHLKFTIFFVSIFGWILNGFWLTFRTHVACFFKVIASHFRAQFLYVFFSNFC